ncbi:MAG: hemerythrin domain-containing protein [Desulfotomaculaceae bacterium]|nr:hemerythrin domain-containing protein [Desulfotomaculaceae bacterium]
MLWMGKFHKEHLAITGILPKLEGNLMEIEHGEAGHNVIWELLEFADLIKNVLIPHFNEEDNVVYPQAASVSEESRAFIEGMNEEHELLYQAFDGYLQAIDGTQGKTNLSEHSIIAVQGIAASKNINIEEAPKNLDKLIPENSLDDIIDIQEILKHGYQIVKILGEHIRKEETTLTMFLKQANEVKGQV